jgi:hypothetical protein
MRDVGVVKKGESVHNALSDEEKAEDEAIDRAAKDPCIECKIKDDLFCRMCAKKKRHKRILKFLGED